MRKAMKGSRFNIFHDPSWVISFAKSLIISKLQDRNSDPHGNHT